VASLLVAPDPSLGHFYAVAACLGCFGALFQPRLAASLPNLVPQQRVVAANSVVASTFHISVMAGPMLGGLLATHIGTSSAFMVNAGSFLVSAAILTRLPLRHTPMKRTRGAHLRELAEGLRYSFTTPLVRGIFIVIGLSMLAASIKAPLEPIFILRAIGGSPQDLGFTEAAWGLGMLLGAIAAPVAARRWQRVRLLPAGMIAIGSCVVLASTATSLFPVLLLWLVAGSGNALVTVSYESLLQQTTPDNLRGRVVAGSEAVLDSAIIGGALLAGWLGSAYGVRNAYLAAGVMMIAVGIFARFLLLPVGRKERAEPMGAAAQQTSAA
jgi:predicted MFS family arabinose efflux permease